jgi:hypothetical protein
LPGFEFCTESRSWVFSTHLKPLLLGRQTLRGIDEQVAKAQRTVDGHAPVKRHRYIQLTGATKSVNRSR